MYSTNGRLKPSRRSISFNFSACGKVRGKPSKTNPLAQSGCEMRSSTMPSTISSGTNSPRSMIGFASRPNGVPGATWSRNMSPVERCGIRYRRAPSCACVPFPARGGPRKITARFRPAAGVGPKLATAAAQPSFPHKPFVVAHHQLRFELLHGVHSHADYNQQRSAAEIERHAKTFQDEAPRVGIKPSPQGAGQVMQFDAGNHPFRDQADQGEINATNESQPPENLVDVFGRVPPRSDAGNEPAVLAHVVSELRRIEHDAYVEEREQNDQRDVDQRVQRLAPRERLGEFVEKLELPLEEQGQRSREREQGTGENRRDHPAGVHP